MGRGYRSGRLGEEIRRIISELLISGIKDPRLQSAMVSISGVEVTSDGSYATCYVTVLMTGAVGPELTEEQKAIQEEVLAGMNSAKGMFKKEIGKKIKLRHIPELIFKIDNSMEYGRHISKVIKELNIEDEE